MIVRTANLDPISVFFAGVVLVSLCAAKSTHVYADGSSAISIDDLVSIRDIKTFVVSPNGNYVAYQVFEASSDRNGYDTSWYIVTTKPDGVPFRVSDGGDPLLSKSSAGHPTGQLTPNSVVWALDNYSIYYTLRTKGETQVWQSKYNQVGREQLTHNAADVQELKYSDDGTILLFTVGRIRADIRAADEQQARIGYLAQEAAIYDRQYGPLWPPCKASNAPNNFGQTTTSRSCQLVVWALDLQTGIERVATASETEEFYSRSGSLHHASVDKRSQTKQTQRLEVLSADGARLAWIQDSYSEASRSSRPIAEMVVAYGDDIFRCSIDECVGAKFERLWWSIDNHEVIFLVRNGPNNTLSSLYGWLPGADTVRTILSNDDLVVDCEMVGRNLVCGRESWTSPRKIVSIDVSNGRVATVADMNPEFREFNFTEIEKIVGEDIYGNPAHAHLVYPRGYLRGKRYPLVVVQYRSRGFLRGGVGNEQPIHVLAQYGFAVLSFETPDSQHRAWTTDPLDRQTIYLEHAMIERGPVTALERMIDTLDSRGIIDAAKVGISGISHGATTVDSAILFRDYAAASAGYSMSAPPNFDVSSSSFWGSAMDAAFGGTPYSPIGFATRARYSVGVNASRINTPYLIQVADREYHITRQNYHALRDSGKPVELWIYPDEYHVKWQPSHRHSVYRRNLQWFQFWLQGVEVDDPVDPDQYERWRTMRDDHCTNLRAQDEVPAPIYCH